MRESGNNIVFKPRLAHTDLRPFLLVDVFETLGYLVIKLSKVSLLGSKAAKFRQLLFIKGKQPNWKRDRNQSRLSYRLFIALPAASRTDFVS